MVTKGHIGGERYHPVLPRWSSRNPTLSDLRPKMSSIFPSPCITDQVKIGTCKLDRHVPQNGVQNIVFEIFSP